MRDPPGEERLHIRAAFQGVTGARKSRVLLLLGVLSLFLMALVYGIATTGRGRQEKAATPEVTPGGGGEWLKKIPDTPQRAPEPPVSPPPKALPPPAHPPLPPPGIPGRAPVSAGAPQISPEEQFRLEREKKRREALLAALSAPPVIGNAAGAVGARTLALPPQEAPAGGGEGAQGVGARARMMNPGNPSLAGRGGISGEDARDMQAEKAEFLKAAAARTPGYLDEARTPPIGEYEVKAGSIIPAVLLSGINSDLPGAVVAQVRETVYDYVSARHVLIPQGSRLMGRYDSRIAYGQERVLVVWERILFPDGSSLMLKGMPGTDSIGQGGSADEVDNHYGKLLGGVILSSILGVGAQAAYGPRMNTSDPTLGQLAMEGIAGNVNQAGQQITRKNLNIQPTLVIRPGYLFNVLVTRDLVLPPYADAERQE